MLHVAVNTAHLPGLQSPPHQAGHTVPCQTHRQDELCHGHPQQWSSTAQKKKKEQKEKKSRTMSVDKLHSKASESTSMHKRTTGSVVEMMAMFYHWSYDDHSAKITWKYHKTWVPNHSPSTVVWGELNDFVAKKKIFVVLYTQQPTSHRSMQHYLEAILANQLSMPATTCAGQRVCGDHTLGEWAIVGIEEGREWCRSLISRQPAHGGHTDVVRPDDQELLQPKSCRKTPTQHIRMGMHSCPTSISRPSTHLINWWRIFLGSLDWFL